MHWISLVNSVVMGAVRTLGRASASTTPRRAASRSDDPVPPPALAGATVESGFHGREGRVVFRHRTAAFTMYVEFGGGDVVATVDVPSEQMWTRSTGLEVELRRPLLQFIGESLVHQQLGGGRGRFEIHDRYISLHASESNHATG